jgi:hypothetical protein
MGYVPCQMVCHMSICRVTSPWLSICPVTWAKTPDVCTPGEGLRYLCSQNVEGSRVLEPCCGLDPSSIRQETTAGEHQQPVES